MLQFTIILDYSNSFFNTTMHVWLISQRYGVIFIHLLKIQKHNQLVGYCLLLVLLSYYAISNSDINHLHGCYWHRSTEKIKKQAHSICVESLLAFLLRAVMTTAMFGSQLQLMFGSFWNRNRVYEIMVLAQKAEKSRIPILAFNCYLNL